jgi:hypothetical protein
VTRTSEYRERLRALDQWEAFLTSESRLPGPRANLELVQAVADEGSLVQFRSWLADDSEFLALCGAVGLGRLIAEGRDDLVPELRAHAGDSRWRVREGVAMGLQRIGARSMHRLLAAIEPWSRGSWLEKRAVVAGLCEPALLRDEAVAVDVLRRLDEITLSLTGATVDRGSEEFRALRKALAYGWSIAVVGNPRVGKPLLERWLERADRDASWIARENLKKDRLKRLDPPWVEQRLAKQAR